MLLFPTVLDGAEPGRLDPTQKNRLLSNPNSKLSFAVYDPFAATGHELSSIAEATDDSIRTAHPKRIVIETLPGDGTDGHWRFIPAARRAPGVPSEGTWPRMVIMSGYVFRIYCHCSPKDQTILTNPGNT